VADAEILTGMEPGLRPRGALPAAVVALLGTVAAFLLQWWIVGAVLAVVGLGCYAVWLNAESAPRSR
jgi:hypothetical protein